VEKTLKLGESNLLQCSNWIVQLKFLQYYVVYFYTKHNTGFMWICSTKKIFLGILKSFKKI